MILTTCISSSIRPVHTCSHGVGYRILKCREKEHRPNTDAYFLLPISSIRHMINSRVSVEGIIQRYDYGEKNYCRNIKKNV